MKFATWNVNSLTVRLPQVLDWLTANPVDVLALQELKLTDDKFPVDAFRQAGYHAECFGQKTYNGVALLSREPALNVVRNVPGFADDMACRGQRRARHRRLFSQWPGTGLGQV
jgi:exodeoxyribonuclease-3